MASDTTVPIPQPPGLPVIGNILDVDSGFPLGSLLRLAETYGEIFSLTLAGQRRYFIGSHALCNELCDESRFCKKINANLDQVRNGVKDGLFTAYPGEPNWELAHRILLPAFGPLSIRDMFNEMHDVASQLVLKWARGGRDKVIPVVEDFTRLALDTLALCAMDYRFNSYYQENLHPFIEAMGDFLLESGKRAARPAFAGSFYRAAQRKYDVDIATLRKTSDDVVKHRRAHPSDRNDLLNAMINGRDSKTGKTLTDEAITNNMITFLIAGHETTSGLLSFVFYYLLKNPGVFQRAQKEVDDVIGREPVKVEHLTKLQYINAVLRETLRLVPTAPSITVTPLEDTIIGGKYSISKGDTISFILPKIQCDPTVYGEDANQWKPERMVEEKFNSLPSNSWKPFGNGLRACIGRPFAWQEALLAVAILLQNFNFFMEDPSYTLALNQTLTIKPKGFYMRAVLREGMSATHLDRSLVGTTGGSVTEQGRAMPSKTATTPHVDLRYPMSILFGSNTGTCEAFAHKIEANASSHGFKATVSSLDSGTRHLKANEPIVIVTASYEGEPPDNAKSFVAWLDSLTDDKLDHVSYAVFGCGHHDWAHTFQKIPKLIDGKLRSFGAKRLALRGSADAGGGDMFSEFENWEDDVLWPGIEKYFGEAVGALTPSDEDGVQVEVSHPRASLRKDVKEARVVFNTLLTAPGAPEKKHLALELPSGMSYTAGDYLAVLPMNHKDDVDRAMKYFGLSWDSTLTITTSSSSALPCGIPIPARDIFTAYIELNQPATKRNIDLLIDGAKDEAIKNALRRLRGDCYTQEVTLKRVSVMDLLERYQSMRLPLGIFLAIMPPIRVRQYSISSSPLWSSDSCTLTYGILSAPALSGQGRVYYGTASNYLASLTPGDTMHVSVRPSSFHLPADSEAVPVIMICAGTGLAPFRGFIQERAAQLSALREIAPALLFVGCRSPDEDVLHADELERWQAAGVVRVYRAFSRRPHKSSGCRYVQERLWREREEATKLWDSGAKLYICGSGQMGDAVRETVLRIYKTKMGERGRQLGDDADRKAEEWFQKIRSERYAVDVFT